MTMQTETEPNTFDRPGPAAPECIIVSFTGLMMSEPVNPAPDGGDNLTLDIQDILRILPHRFPLLLVDRIIHITRTKRIVAIKNVTINEPFFAGHFPEHPIMPGVLVVEAMAQAGAVLLLIEIPKRDDKLLLFTGIERAPARLPLVSADDLPDGRLRSLRRQACRRHKLCLACGLRSRARPARPPRCEAGRPGLQAAGNAPARCR